MIEAWEISIWSRDDDIADKLLRITSNLEDYKIIARLKSRFAPNNEYETILVAEERGEADKEQCIQYLLSHLLCCTNFTKISWWTSYRDHYVVIEYNGLKWMRRSSLHRITGPAWMNRYFVLGTEFPKDFRDLTQEEIVDLAANNPDIVTATAYLKEQKILEISDDLIENMRVLTL